MDKLNLHTRNIQYTHFYAKFLLISSNYHYKSLKTTKPPTLLLNHKRYNSYIHGNIINASNKGILRISSNTY